MFLVSLFSSFSLWGRKAFIIEHFFFFFLVCMAALMGQRGVSHEDVLFCACEEYVFVSVKRKYSTSLDYKYM